MRHVCQGHHGVEHAALVLHALGVLVHLPAPSCLAQAVALQVVGSQASMLSALSHLASRLHGNATML